MTQNFVVFISSSHGCPSGPRGQTQVLVVTTAWVRLPLHASVRATNSFAIFCYSDGNAFVLWVQYSVYTSGV
jgi:hypothetical protein